MSGYDFNLKIKVRSARIVRAMRAAGFHTVAELSRTCGVNQATLGALLNMQKSPWLRGDKIWSSAAMQMSETLNVMPTDLWPEHLRDVKPNRGGAELEISGPELAAIAGYGPDMEEITEDKLDIAAALDAIPERESRAIRLNFGIGCGAHTLDEIGPFVGGVSRERVRQIVAKGMGRIKTRAYRSGAGLWKRA